MKIKEVYMAVDAIGNKEGYEGGDNGVTHIVETKNKTIQVWQDKHLYCTIYIWIEVIWKQ